MLSAVVPTYTCTSGIRVILKRGYPDPFSEACRLMSNTSFENKKSKC